MNGLDSFNWRATLGWSEMIALADRVLVRWNTATRFETHTDMRERHWTVRHASQPQPFLVLYADNLRGGVPRIGNPLPFLLLLGICHEHPGAVELTFSNGQRIDPTRFELADLAALLPHATHPAHRQLAALAVEATL